MQVQNARHLYVFTPQSTCSRPSYATAGTTSTMCHQGADSSDAHACMAMRTCHREDCTDKYQLDEQKDQRHKAVAHEVNSDRPPSKLGRLLHDHGGSISAATDESRPPPPNESRPLPPRVMVAAEAVVVVVTQRATPYPLAADLDLRLCQRLACHDSWPGSSLPRPPPPPVPIVPRRARKSFRAKSASGSGIRRAAPTPAQLLE